MNIEPIVKRVASAVALTMVVASASLAQGLAAPSVLAHLASVEGNVLVSHVSGLIAGSKGLALNESVRVITTARSKAVIQFDNGCRVTLEPNQRLVVSREKSCDAYPLLVQNILPGPGIVPVGGPGLSGAALSGSLQTAMGWAIGIAGVAAIIDSRRDDSVSPN